MNTTSGTNSISDTVPDSRKASEHIPALDGIRALAVLMVLSFHFTFGMASGRSTLAGLIFRMALRGAETGWMGVDLFFVLSGFLITGILLDCKNSPNYFRNFYARRILRIFPLYYGVLAGVYIIAHVYPGSENVRDHLSWFWLHVSNFLIARHGWAPTQAHWFTLSHFWSLAIEEQFYLVWPLIVLICPRLRFPLVCLTIAGASIAMRYYLAGHDAVQAYYITLARMDPLVLGGFMSWLVRLPNFGAQHRRRLVWTLCLAAVAVAVICARCHGLANFNPLVQKWAYSGLAVFFAASVALVATGERSAGFIRFFSLAPLRWIGKYSYGIYVYHLLLGSVFSYLLSRETLVGQLHSYPLGCLVHILYLTSCTCCVAWFSWNLYERQFLKLKRFFPNTSPAAERSPYLVLDASLAPAGEPA